MHNRRSSNLKNYFIKLLCLGLALKYLLDCQQHDLWAHSLVTYTLSSDLKKMWINQPINAKYHECGSSLHCSEIFLYRIFSLQSPHVDSR